MAYGAPLELLGNPKDYDGRVYLNAANLTLVISNSCCYQLDMYQLYLPWSLNGDSAFPGTFHFQRWLFSRCICLPSPYNTHDTRVNYAARAQEYTFLTCRRLSYNERPRQVQRIMIYTTTSADCDL